MEAKRYANRALVGKPDEKRPLGKPSCRLQNSQMDLKLVGMV
jgi:hypothetical protein